jgi:hypothetical protein
VTNATGRCSVGYPARRGTSRTSPKCCAADEVDSIVMLSSTDSPGSSANRSGSTRIEVPAGAVVRAS